MSESIRIFTDTSHAGAVFCNVNIALTSASFNEVNFSNVAIENCNLEGMKINRIPVTELILAYRNSHD